jgi:hypothetical protein
MTDTDNINIELNFDYSDTTDRSPDYIKYLYDITNYLKNQFREYCTCDKERIIVPRFTVDVAFMSIEFEYTDSTICEELIIDLDGADVIIPGTYLSIPCTKPNLFETNFVSSLHVKCLYYAEPCIRIKTPTKNFKSVKINMKFDNTHAISRNCTTNHSYQLTRQKWIQFSRATCCIRDNIDETLPIIKYITPPTTLEETDYDNSCMVCYETLDEEVGFETTKCGHKYCRGCYDAHMKIDNKCAMCRTVLKKEKRSSIGDWGLTARIGSSGRVLSARETAVELGWELPDDHPQTFDIVPPTTYEPTGPDTLNPVYVPPNQTSIYNYSMVPPNQTSIYNYSIVPSNYPPSGSTNLTRWWDGITAYIVPHDNE